MTPQINTIWIEEMDTNGIWDKVPIDIPVEPKKSDIRCYILANHVLPPIHAGIQAGHSLAEMVHFGQHLSIVKKWVEEDKTLVLLSATVDQMAEMKAFFEKTGRHFSSFKEPDLNNLETAVAFEPMDAVEGKIIFGKFKLFK